MRQVASFEEFAAQVRYFVELAAGYKADFVLFPEFASMPLLSAEAHRGLSAADALRHLADQTPAVFRLYADLANQHGVYVIGGSQPVRQEPGTPTVFNVSPIATPEGRVWMQPKLQITPWEKETWGIVGGRHLATLDTPKAKIGVLICYDSEFPEAARYLAEQGVELLFVPYCTDDRQGYLRVRLCCQARAIEHQIYVAATGGVGNLREVPGLDLHYGQAAVFTPSDFSFARDGVQAEADANVEALLVTELDLDKLHRARVHGSVRPRFDRREDLFQVATSFEEPTLPEYVF
jgi:predicted amidohydrolase